MFKTRIDLPMMMDSERCFLRWNNHQRNILSVFEQLFTTGTFTDVILAVEDQHLKAHKIILAACSHYFNALFLNHQDVNPIVTLKDVPYDDMKSLLDFMYRGEVYVDQERLTAFERLGESLGIKGLAGVNDNKSYSSEFQPIQLQGIQPYEVQQQQEQCQKSPQYNAENACSGGGDSASSSNGHQMSATQQQQQQCPKSPQYNAENACCTVNDNENTINTPQMSTAQKEQEQEQQQQHQPQQPFSSLIGDTQSINKLLLLKKRNRLDTLYGAHIDLKSGKWMYGNSSFMLSKDVIKVGNSNWPHTPGLFQLMFCTYPQNYDSSDLDNYKMILLKTNAYRLHYKADGQIKGTAASKYRDIIFGLIKHQLSKKQLVCIAKQKQERNLQFQLQTDQNVCSSGFDNSNNNNGPQMSAAQKQREQQQQQQRQQQQLQQQQCMFRSAVTAKPELKSALSEDVDNTTIITKDLSILKRRNQLDTCYGLHQDVKSGKWMFGNSPLMLTQEIIGVGNKNWSRTPGLFQLMFCTHPQNYDSSDLDNYKMILLNTNAYRLHYKADGQIKGTTALKYSDIIFDLIKHQLSKRQLVRIAKQQQERDLQCQLQTDENVCSSGFDNLNNNNGPQMSAAQKQQQQQAVTTLINDLSILKRRNQLDTSYGLHQDVKSGKWMFGNSPLMLTREIIKVGNKNWLRTPGLFQLMFCTYPQNYDNSDLDNYKSILIKTNAHKHNFEAKRRVKGTKAHKYRNIIFDLTKHQLSKKQLARIARQQRDLQLQQQTDKNISSSGGDNANNHNGPHMFAAQQQEQQQVRVSPEVTAKNRKRRTRKLSSTSDEDFDEIDVEVDDSKIGNDFFSGNDDASENRSDSGNNSASNESQEFLYTSKKSKMIKTRNKKPKNQRQQDGDRMSESFITSSTEVLPKLFPLSISNTAVNSNASVNSLGTIAIASNHGMITLRPSINLDLGIKTNRQTDDKQILDVQKTSQQQDHKNTLLQTSLSDLPRPFELTKVEKTNTKTSGDYYQQ